MQYRNIVTFEVFGDYALFSDPVLRVGGEKCTYQIPTYEAIKGVLASVYWKPTLIWYIDKVRIMNQIQTETKAVRPIAWEGKKTSDLSYYTYLKDCRYKVQAHFEWNMNRSDLEKDRIEGKHYQIALRKIKEGSRRDVFLGTRECQAYVQPCNFDDETGRYDDVSELGFGLMYHGITYADEAWNDATKEKMTANYWYPVMKNGIIEYLKPESCPLHRTIRDMKVKPFNQSLENFSGLDEFKDEL